MAVQEVKKVENEEVSIDMVDANGCLLSLKIFVKSEPTKNAYKKAVKLVNKEISIPGFRKGKAPDATVIGRYSSYVEQEWKELLVNLAYRAALELTNIYPLNKQSVQRPKIEKCSQEEGAVVTITYEHAPLVPTVNFSEISLPLTKKVPISEERVEELLKEVRTTHADWETIADRPVQDGDYVELSIDAIDDPTAPSSIVKERRLQVSKEKMAPWLTDALIGMQSGEIVETTIPSDKEGEENQRKVRVTLHAIKKIILPELSDELAKKAGAENLDKLTQKIRSNLEGESEEEAKKVRVEALENALIEKYHFDLPASIVEAEREYLLKKEIESLKKDQNLSDEEIKSQEEKLESKIAEQIDRKIRLYYLNKQIQNQENITLTHEELNQEFNTAIQMRRYLYGEELGKEEIRKLASQVAFSLLHKKAFDRALEKI